MGHFQAEGVLEGFTKQIYLDLVIRTRHGLVEIWRRLMEDYGLEHLLFSMSPTEKLD